MSNQKKHQKRHISSYERRIADERRKRVIERYLFIGLSILAILLAFAVVYLYA